MIWLGLVAVIGAYFLWLNHRRLYDFEGESAQFVADDGSVQRYELSERNVGKTGIVRKIGVHLPQQLQFDIAREDFLSRLLESVGIGREILTRDSRFDRTYTVQSEDARVALWIRGAKEARTAVDTLFRDDAHRVVAYAGRIWVEIHRPKDRTPASRVEIARIANLLVQIVASVPASVRGNGAPDNWWARAVLPLAISNGALALSIAFFFRHAFHPFPAHLNMPQVYLKMAPFVFLISLALLWFGAWWLKDSSRARVVLAELLLVGTPSLMFAGLSLAGEINMNFARGAAEVREAEVISTEVKRGRRSRSYYVYLEPLAADQNGAMRLKVSSFAYEAARTNPALRVRWQRGAFGFPFVLEEPQAVRAP